MVLIFQVNCSRPVICQSIILFCFLFLCCQPESSSENDEKKSFHPKKAAGVLWQNYPPTETDSLLWGAWDWQYSLDPSFSNYVRPTDAGIVFRMQFSENRRVHIYRKSLNDFAFVLDSTYHYTIADAKFDTLKIDKLYEPQNASIFYPLEYSWYLIGFYGSDTLQLQGFFEDTRKRGPFYDYFVRLK